MSNGDYEWQEAECDERQSAPPVAFLWQFRLMAGNASVVRNGRRELIRRKLPSCARPTTTMVNAASLLFE